MLHLYVAKMSDVTDRTPGRSVLRTGHTNADRLHSFLSLNGFISVERTFDDVLQRSKKFIKKNNNKLSPRERVWATGFQICF